MDIYVLIDRRSMTVLAADVDFDHLNMRVGDHPVWCDIQEHLDIQNTDLQGL